MSSSMRVAFDPPTQEEFLSLLSVGGSHTGVRGGIRTVNFGIPPPTRFHQRGGGFFSSIANIAKTVAPFLFRTIAPSAVKFTQGVIHDIGTGQRGLKQSLKMRGIDALSEVGSRIMRGGQRKKRKRTTKNKTKTRKRVKRCKRKIGDVFDMI